VMMMMMMMMTTTTTTTKCPFESNGKSKTYTEATSVLYNIGLKYFRRSLWSNINHPVDSIKNFTIFLITEEVRKSKYFNSATVSLPLAVYKIKFLCSYLSTM
jgi:hypothetical protein